MARKKRSKKKSTPRKREIDGVTEDAEAAEPPVNSEDDEAGEPSESDEAVVEDLDAVLDEDLDGVEDLDALIAATVAGATAEEHEEAEDVPVVSLDEEPPPAEDATTHEIPAERAPSGAAADGEQRFDEDLDGAFDLGEASSPEARDRLLAQALAHAEMQDARYRVPYAEPGRAGRWKLVAAALLFALSCLAWLAPPSWVRPAPPAQLDAAGRALSVRRALLLQAQQVEAYRVRFQRLPTTLEDLSGSLPDIRYVRSGNRVFQLTAYGPNGESIVFDSGGVTPDFEDVATGWGAGVGP